MSGDHAAGPTVADLVRRYVTEVWNGGNTALLAELATADHIRHGPDGDLYGPEGFAVAISEYHAALRDLRLTVLDIVAAGSFVACRVTLRGRHTGFLLGHPPTDQEIEVGGVELLQLADGRLAESWLFLDILGLTRQICPPE